MLYYGKMFLLAEKQKALDIRKKKNGKISILRAVFLQKNSIVVVVSMLMIKKRQKTMFINTI